VSERVQPAGGLIGAGLVRHYRRGAETVSALAGVDLRVDAGEFVALAGPSGSGKSTLLALLCGWETPDQGELRYLGPLGDRRPETFGWRDLALVPQALGLVADLSLADNVLLPARPTGTPTRRPWASSSGSPSPGHCCCARRCCWPTNPPRTRTAGTPTGCSTPSPRPPGAGRRC
jgi:energy-coupling factor transporter ATP-binding protein EcfA2